MAVDAATAPTLRAQELRFAWEQFLCDDDERAGRSARRSRTPGAAADARRGPDRRAAAPSSPTRTRSTSAAEEHPLAPRAPLIHECLSVMADEAGYLIVVSDATACC